MKQDEIIEMAAICGIIPWTKHEYIGGNRFSASDDGLDGDIAALIQFAKMVEDKSVAKEREACAKVCDDMHAEYEGADVQATWCAAAIRARGQE